MKTYVLDSCVAAKWVLPEKGETFVTESLAIYDLFARDELGLTVPDLFWPELGNILWKAARAGRIPSASVSLAMQKMVQLGIRTFPTQPLMDPALAIAIHYGRPIYDAVYVALAVTSNRVLVTADERLVNSLGTYFPVRWIGASGSTF